MHIPHIHIHFAQLLGMLASAFHAEIRGGDLHVKIGDPKRPLRLNIPVEDIAEHLAGRAVAGMPAQATDAFRAVLPLLMRTVAGHVERAEDGTQTGG